MKYKYFSGMILVFPGGSCPSGWTRFSVADNKLLRGAVSVGSGGGGGHTHSLDPAAHQTNNFDATFVTAMSAGAAETVVLDLHNHFYIRGDTVSANADPSPPYKDVVLCKKD